MKLAKSYPTLCHSMDYTVHGILQARILECVAVPFPRGSFQPRDWTQVSHIAGGFFTSWATREAPIFDINFPDSSVGKESACNAWDPGSIPGLGRSAREGIGYPLQCSWASLVAQLVKNPPAKWNTWVWSLSWEDPLEKRKATHFSSLAWRIPWTV